MSKIIFILDIYADILEMYSYLKSKFFYSLKCNPGMTI